MTSIFIEYQKYYEELQTTIINYKITSSKYNFDNNIPIYAQNETSSSQPNQYEQQQQQQQQQQPDNNQSDAQEEHQDIPSGEPNEKNISKELPVNKIEKDNNIFEKMMKKICLKVLFIFHPDKNIKPDEEIFDKIKSKYDINDYTTLCYYFIIEQDNPYLQQYFHEYSRDPIFENYIVVLNNEIINKTNQLNTFIKEKSPK